MSNDKYMPINSVILLPVVAVCVGSSSTHYLFHLFHLSLISDSLSLLSASSSMATRSLPTNALSVTSDDNSSVPRDVDVKKSIRSNGIQILLQVDIMCDDENYTPR